MPEMPEAPHKKEEDLARDFQNQESEDGIVPVDAKKFSFLSNQPGSHAAWLRKKLNF
jgi:hypothetical protein